MILVGSQTLVNNVEFISTILFCVDLFIDAFSIDFPPLIRLHRRIIPD